MIQTSSQISNGLVHMIGNKPDKETIFSFWMILDDQTARPGHIAEFWKSELETDAGYFKGKPSRLFNIGFGYDESNVIVLGIITYPKGEPEMGGSSVLGAPTSYMIVASRTLTFTGTPFSYQDKVYGVQQVSPSLYYSYSHYTLTYLQNLAGVSLISNSPLRPSVY